MTYFERINELTRQVSPQLVDFSQPRDRAHTPTQASSNFITNKEQGDWAESLVMRAINETARHHVAVKYGKSDDLVAGEEGFDIFFQEFQDELDTIGKRPNLLVFKKKDFDPALGFDISHIPHHRITNYVKKAVAGIEVRSSAFLIDKYEDAMQERIERFMQTALAVKASILDEYRDLLSQPSRSGYIDMLESLNERTLYMADFKVPGWRANERLTELNNLFKQLKGTIREIQKRDYLSITPKVEDIKVVHRWIEMFNVPHFYFQVFFDKIYGISFEQILSIISNPDNDGTIYSIESDTKNQNKTTIKINSKAGTEIATRVTEPDHRSVRKEMGRGRLLFYVSFEGGTACLDIDRLTHILNIERNSF